MNLIYFRRHKYISSFQQLLEELKPTGIKSICLSETMGDIHFLNPDKADQAGQLLEAHGISARAMHGIFRGIADLNTTDPDQAVANHLQMMTNCAALGVKTYVLHPGLPVPGRTMDEEWQVIRRTLDCLLPVAELLELTIAVENLPPAYIGSRPEDLLRVVEEFSSPSLGLCYDSGHAHMCGDAAGILRDMAPHIVTMHLHDNDGTDDRHLTPGDGTIDWAPLVKAIPLCPRLIHMEIEAFNREGRPHKDLYKHYEDLLQPVL